MRGYDEVGGKTGGINLRFARGLLFRTPPPLCAAGVVLRGAVGSEPGRNRPMEVGERTGAGAVLRAAIAGSCLRPIWRTPVVLRAVCFERNMVREWVLEVGCGGGRVTWVVRAGVVVKVVVVVVR